ncbi:MAG: hypothetical protein IT242_11505 [Bacteroidia bacterium]|nr:hypothetical protein [Bacteroidia bacterium]
MTALEIQDFIHVYCMFSFRDGRKEPGIIVNKYNVVTAQIEYYFIPQLNMQAYKNAFEKYDKESCSRLCEPVEIHNLVSIKPVSLSDYKIIMQLLQERNQQLNMLH